MQHKELVLPTKTAIEPFLALLNSAEKNFNSTNIYLKYKS